MTYDTPRLFVSLLCALWLVSTPSVHGDESGTEKSDDAKSVKLNGVFESVQATELSADTEQLSSLTIRSIIPHGSRVRKGQVVVAFDTEDVDRKIKEARRALQLSKLTMEDDEFSFAQFLATQKLDRANAERTYKSAKQSYDNFMQVDRDQSVASAKFSLKSSQASLENAMEELKQLEQMYKEDELTEESEEIVLKRAKQSVESAQFRLKNSEIQTQRNIEQSIPDRELQHNDSLARAELAYQKSLKSLQLARQRREIEIDGKREKLQKEEDDLKVLVAERRSLQIQAPHDGIVFHGQLSRGKLSDKPGSLKKEAKVSGSQVLATVTDPSKLQIRVDLTEAQLNQVTPGTRGHASPAVNTSLKLPVTVKSVDTVPFANNKFDCLLVIGKSKDAAFISPGTSCSITLPVPES